MKGKLKHLNAGIWLKNWISPLLQTNATGLLIKLHISAFHHFPCEKYQNQSFWFFFFVLIFTRWWRLFSPEGLGTMTGCTSKRKSVCIYHWYTELWLRLRRKDHTLSWHHETERKATLTSCILNCLKADVKSHLNLNYHSFPFS